MGYIASKSLASAIQSPAEAARAPFGETTTEILRESSFWQIEGNEIESPSSHARRHLSARAGGQGHDSPGDDQDDRLS